MNSVLLLVLLIIFLYILSPLISNSNCCASCGSTELEASFSGHPIYNVLDVDVLALLAKEFFNSGDKELVRFKDKECF